MRDRDGPTVRVHAGLGEDAAEFALACAGALPLDAARASLGLGGHHRHLHAIHEHIHFGNAAWGNDGQDKLFRAGDFPSVPLSDLRAHSLGGAFDGFGGDLQTGQQFHRFAGWCEGHFAAYHRRHAPDTRRGSPTGYTQLGVSGGLPLRAMRAQVIGAAHPYGPHHGQ